MSSAKVWCSLCSLFNCNRSSHKRCSIKRAVLKNLAIFTEKHLHWSLFRPSKETPTQVFFCEYCQIFKSTYFEEHLQMAASIMRTRLRASYLVNVNNYENMSWTDIFFPTVWYWIVWNWILKKESTKSAFSDRQVSYLPYCKRRVFWNYLCLSVCFSDSYSVSSEFSLVTARYLSLISCK